MRSLLSEALGVPENIYKTAVQVYKSILNVLKSKSITDFDSDTEIDKKITIRGNFKISDYLFDQINFTINIKKFQFVEEPTMFSMTITADAKLTDKLKIKSIVNNYLNISMLIGVPEDFDVKNIVRFFIEKRPEIIENLSHELKHGYDRFKRPNENPAKRAEYNAVSGKRFGLIPIDTFLHDMYYATVSESLVRPSEIEAAIRNNRISQKDFLNFLQKNETYTNLKRISNFSTTNLKSELKKDIPKIDRFLRKINVDIDGLSDDEKVDELLRLVWVNVTNWNIENMKDILTTSFLEKVIGFSGEKERVFRRFITRNTRFKNYQEFFNYYENYLHDVANKMIKKISKLYAIIK